MIADESTLRIRRELQGLCGERGWVNGANLVQRLADATQLLHLEVRHSLLLLSQTGIITNIGPTGDPLGRVGLVERLVEESLVLPEHARHWLELVALRGMDPVIEAALRDVAPALAGLSREDMQHLLDGITRLAEDRASFVERDPYEISAKYLLGSSKILARLGRALERMGLQEGTFGSRPRYVLGAGPKLSAFTLLVENPECFERLVKLGIADRLTIVATYGYGITWSGIGLERRLDRIKIACVAGKPVPTLQRAVTGNPCCFWGDLDQAGLDIFIKLRGPIPHLQLSALYKPMLVAVTQTRTSHPYCELVEKSGQLPVISGDEAVTEFATACAHRAVDQEFVSDQDILVYAGKPYSPNME